MQAIASDDDAPRYSLLRREVWNCVALLRPTKLPTLDPDTKIPGMQLWPVRQQQLGCCFGLLTLTERFYKAGRWQRLNQLLLHWRAPEVTGLRVQTAKSTASPLQQAAQQSSSSGPSAIVQQPDGGSLVERIVGQLLCVRACVKDEWRTVLSRITRCTVTRPRQCREQIVEFARLSVLCNR